MHANFLDPPGDGGPLDLGGAGFDPNSPKFQAAEEACKALSPKGGAPPDPQAQPSRLQESLRYAACMRSHGVPTFPDPTVDEDGMGFGDLLQSDINPRAPVYRAAERACQMPGSPAPKPVR